MGLEDSVQNIAGALKPSEGRPSARWRWATVTAANQDGTLDVSVEGSALQGIRTAQHCTGAKVGDRVRVSYLGTDALVDAVRADGPSETIYETSGITVKRWGRMVMVQCHGIHATPGTAVSGIDLSSFKPSYNASAIIADTANTTHLARLWVSASDGSVNVAFAGYTGASDWYGTLAYIY